MTSQIQDIIQNCDENYFYIQFPEKNILGLGVKSYLEISEKSSLDEIDQFLIDNKNEFIFCLLSYDLKKLTHQIENPNISSSGPLAVFMVAEQLYNIELNSDSNGELKNDKSDIFNIDQKDYLEKLAQIQQHIQRGDIYETNFCVNPNLEIEIDPIETFKRLNQVSKAPFSGLIKWNNQYIISCSPERFIKKKNTKLSSQPIKGTIKRGASHEEDEQLKKELLANPKEVAENIMIVDLVRNDLSRIAQRNSVKVEHLNSVETFNTVHQLVSTISCELKEDIEFSDILKATFPMGSMTGAPKKRAMELMMKYETFQRSFYSGSFGYIDEKGDFDFNVIIRSILYNSESKKASFPVGGAITIKSNPILEYEECKLKANSMMKVITNA